MMLASSWNLSIHSILDLRRLQKVLRHTLRKLIALCPLPNCIEITAFVLRVEVHEWLGIFRVNPDLAEDPDINSAHELLS
jgi:hypothetical protein